MRKIAFIVLVSLPLFADFFPQTVHTSISSVHDTSVTLSTPLPVNRMSAVVIHNYSQDAEAITTHILQTGASKCVVLNDDIVAHTKLPSINTKVAVGDKVIGGYLYNNILVLAPDAKTYDAITTASDKNWIHPDLYALFLNNYGEHVPSKENLKSFAKAYQIGLVYIVTKTSEKLLDPISGFVVAKKPLSISAQKIKTPFFMRLDKINVSIFSRKNTKTYYQLMDAL
jgi:hypothetical protein